MNTWNYLYAKYRGFADIACFDTPRPDVLHGWRRWRWLALQRRTGRLVEPSIRIQGDVANLETRLKLGVGSLLDFGCIVWLGRAEKGGGCIELRDRVYVGAYSFLGSSQHNLQIGEDTMIGAHSYVITENHVTARTDIPYAAQGFEGADITIGRNVWIGCNVSILPGVTIGDHAIIGAGAVVTKAVPSRETWGGVPAKKIGEARTDQR